MTAKHTLAPVLTGVHLVSTSLLLQEGKRKLMRQTLGNKRDRVKVKVHTHTHVHTNTHVLLLKETHFRKSFLLSYTFIELVQNSRWAVGRFPSENTSIKVREFSCRSVLRYNE